MPSRKPGTRMDQNYLVQLLYDSIDRVLADRHHGELSLQQSEEHSRRPGFSCQAGYEPKPTGLDKLPKMRSNPAMDGGSDECPEMTSGSSGRPE
eukprot:10400317-Karenia_brevis.AAC.1